jgi:hypothetical protein
MGMSHDFSPKHAGRNCNGIMDYGDSEDAWSECSRDDFRAQYAVQLRTTGKHCMESESGVQFTVTKNHFVNFFSS